MPDGAFNGGIPMNEGRIQKVKDWLKEEGQTFAFIHTTANVFYLSGLYTDPHERVLGVVVLPEGEPFMVCPGMERSQAKGAGWTYEIVGYSDSEDPWAKMQEALAGLGVTAASSIAVEKETLPYARGEKLLGMFNDSKLVGAEVLLNELRLIKEESELETLREAARLADYGVEVGVAALKEGVTEMEVLAKIEYELKKKGISQMSFSTMVLFGEKAGQPHGKPGLRKLQKGDFVLFDLGVVLDGYCSDITRTVAFGDLDEKRREIYDTVLQAQLKALEASKPGTRIGDLDVIARNHITEAGYGDNFPHRIGHGLGIDVHEFPSMSDNNDGVLREGMTYTIEPGIYIDDIGGVRIEDDVVVTADGYETLTKYPKELQIIK
jgi:Xaa-Pro dipeptidase